MNVQPAEVIQWLERNNGLILDGAFVTNPNAFKKMFENFGVSARVNFFAEKRNDEIELMAQSSSSVILTFVNPGGISSGVHNVTSVWNPTTNSSNYLQQQKRFSG